MALIEKIIVQEVEMTRDGVLGILTGCISFGVVGSGNVWT